MKAVILGAGLSSLLLLSAFFYGKQSCRLGVQKEITEEATEISKKIDEVYSKPNATRRELLDLMNAGKL